MKTTRYFVLVLAILASAHVNSQAQSSGNNKYSGLVAKIFKSGNSSPTAKLTNGHTFSKKSNHHLPIHTTYLNWSGSRWDSANRNVFTYNTDDRIQLSVYQSYQGSGFTDLQRTAFTYDAQGRAVTSFTETPDGTGWKNYSRDTTAFNSMGIEIYYLYQRWVNNNWENNFGNQSLITYDTNGVMKQMVQQGLDSAGNWSDQVRITFSHNSSGDIDGGTIEMYEDGNWQEFARIINARFLDNNFDLPISYTMQVPVPVFGWMNFQRVTSYYNSNNMPDSSLTETYAISGQRWENASLERYAFDTAGNRTLFTMHEWVINKWEIRAGQKDSFSYNAQGNLASQTTQAWNPNLADWENQQMQVHTYSGTSGIVSAAIPFSSHKIFPNPVREVLTIEARGVKADRVKISVSDITGRIVFSDNISVTGGMLNTSVNTSEFKTGIYILQIQAGNQLVNQKLVKE